MAWKLPDHSEWQWFSTPCLPQHVYGQWFLGAIGYQFYPHQVNDGISTWHQRPAL